MLISLIITGINTINTLIQNTRKIKIVGTIFK